MTESANWLNRRAAHAVLAQRMPFLQSDYQIDVWIDLPIEEARQTFIPFRISTEQDGNGTRLRCGRDRLDLFAAMLLTTGRDIVIHSPAELRETFSNSSAAPSTPPHTNPKLPSHPERRAVGASRSIGSTPHRQTLSMSALA